MNQVEQNISKITRITNPANSKHYMILTMLEGTFKAEINGYELACSESVIKLQEVANAPYAPIIYFSRQDVRMEHFSLSDKLSTCPLKGTASYYHLLIKLKQFDDIAWSYEKVFDFDSNLKIIEGMLAFDIHQVQSHIE